MIVGAVVLAAGKSERMGDNKLFLSLNGKTLLDNILDAVTAAGISVQVIVLGHEPELVNDALKPRLPTLKITVNDDYKQGMTSSFQTGLRLLPHVDATFLVLGDELIFDPNLLKLMIHKMENSLDKALIISPIHNGKKGHPLLFHRQLFPEILNLKNNRTIRDIVHLHADRLLTIEASQWTILDIDTPEDYGRISDLIKSGNWIL
jgi:molybdenum cofactor cytidylyltransferase